MNIAMDHPYWLLLSLIGIVSGIYGWRQMRGIPRFRRGVAISFRVLLFVLLGIAMSGIYRVQETDDLAIIALVDTSESVQNFADLGVDDLGLPISIGSAAQYFLAQSSVNKAPDDRLGLIAFDGRSQTIAIPSRSNVLNRSIDIQPIDGTDLVGAIQQARVQLPPDANSRIIVFSDGRSTTHGLDQIPSDIPIDVVPIRYAIENEVIVESVELPARSLPGSVVDVRVVVRSLGSSRGELLLRYNNEPVDLDSDATGFTRRVEIGPGQRVFVFPVELGSSRVHRFEAQYIPDQIAQLGETSSASSRFIGDTSQGNNTAGGITMSAGDGRVLIVADQREDGESNASHLIETLATSGWKIDAINPAQFPSDLLMLEAYDLVMLVNTPRDALQLSADELISAYVRDLGGGVVFVGGREALGAGGWRGSTIEKILPVKLDVADDLIAPQVAVVLVLDSSGSMRRNVMGSSRSQQAIANDAAAGALEILDPKDLVGVVAFSSAARKVIDIAPNDQPEFSRSRIASISSSGGTNMGPALKMAQEMLESVDANTKHIVLLSDGESQFPESLPDIADELGALGIKVSTIAVGDEADEKGMAAIAQRSGGVFYRVRNPSVLPRIFLKAIRVVRTPMIREGRFDPVVIENPSVATGSLPTLPSLGGLVLTEIITDDPRVSTPIVSQQGEPIFAFHQVELGRVSVFTSDVSSWARGWIEDPVFSMFWTSAARWTMRTDLNEPGELAFVVSQSQAQIEYNAIDESGAPIDGLDVIAQVFDESGQQRQVPLVQVGAGRYVGDANDLSKGVHVVIASPTNKGASLKPTIAGLQVSGNDELKLLSADPESLIALAKRTGGRVFDLSNPANADLFDRQGVIIRRSFQPIWTVLIVIALVLFLLDLASRRVAFDRWIAQARDETLAATRTVAIEGVGQLQHTKQRVQDQSRSAPEIDRRPMQIKKPDVLADADATKKDIDEDDSNPLLAAKRRARSKMDED